MKTLATIGIFVTLGLSQQVLADARIMGNGNGIQGIDSTLAPADIKKGTLDYLIDGNTSIVKQYFAYQLGQPASFTLTFDRSYDLSSFVLWNDRDLTNHGGHQNQGDGVKGFTLDFFDAGHNKLGSFVGTSPNWVGEIAFDFGNTFAGVASAVFSVDSVYGPGASQWTQLREFGFNHFTPAQGSNLIYNPFTQGNGYCTFPPTDFPEQPIPAVPEAETYALMLAGLGLVAFVARRRQRV